MHMKILNGDNMKIYEYIFTDKKILETKEIHIDFVANIGTVGYYMMFSFCCYQPMTIGEIIELSLHRFVLYSLNKLSVNEEKKILNFVNRQREQIPF